VGHLPGQPERRRRRRRVKGPPSSIPRVTLQVPGEAARALGVSHDFFNEHVKQELKLIYRGRLTLVRVAELERWAVENETRPFAA
jgi:hypothetical protein